MQDSFLSSFTPSLMSPQDLEAIFVQRENLVEDLIAGVRESATTKNKHYRLLIGMRGIGKTYTIALLYHRLKESTELQDKLLIAWLKEEEWGVSSWLDLQIRIFQALSNSYPQEYRDKLATDVEALYQLSPEEATARGEIILKEFTGKRTLLILTENFDEILKGLGDTGQKKFRAYLQNKSFITVVATAQNLSNDFKSKKRAFYGFFNTDNLNKLSLDEVSNLLTKIAQLQEDVELFKFIRSQTGRDRIKAIHHLAGGNHRVYIIFSQFLTRDSLDDLVQPVMQTLDELTPYYQARMQWLSTQQRKIIELLCDRRHAVPVKEIAQRCFISHQTASSQLKDLLNKGYVVKETQGRESFYELLEPLMRICLETKKQHGEPIKLFIDFLRIWYTKEELWQRYLSLPEKAEIEREYLRQAMNISLTHREINIELYSKIKNYISQLNKLELENIFNNADKNDVDNNAWLEIGVILYDVKRYKEAIKAFDIGINSNPNNIDLWRNKAEALFKLNLDEENLYVHDSLILLEPDNSKHWNNKGVVLGRLERRNEELIAYENALKANSKDINSLNNKGLCLMRKQQYKQAIQMFEEVIKLDPNNVSAWNDRSRSLFFIGELDKAIDCVNKALAIDPLYYNAWINKGLILHDIKSDEESIIAFKKAIQINTKKTEGYLCLVYILSNLERYEEALMYCEHLIDIDPDNIAGWSIKCRIQFKTNTLISAEKLIELQPLDINFWCLKGGITYYLKDYSESIKSLDKVLEIDATSYDAYFLKVEPLFQLKKWQAGFESLEHGLSLSKSSNESYEKNSKEIITIIFESKQSKQAWGEHIEVLIKLYDKYQSLSILKKGITENIPNLLSKMVSNKAARTWLEVWQEVAGDQPELEIALRWLKTAVEYKETKGDSKVLLQLPKEERDLFVTLLEDIEE